MNLTHCGAVNLLLIFDTGTLLIEHKLNEMYAPLGIFRVQIVLP